MAFEISSLDFSFYSQSPAVIPLFRDFSLSLSPCSVTSVLGPSGSGKTTLLRLVAGLLSPNGGSVGMRGGNGALRSSFVFQEPRLFPWRSILDNVAIPLEGIWCSDKARERAQELLELVGLSDSLHVRPSELSGGQRQRVSIARAFAWPGELLLMDEPFQSLDLPLRIQLMDLTLTLLESSPRLVLAVTHDPREAIYLADRVIVLSGRPVRSVLDERIELSRDDRRYTSPACAAVEARIFEALTV